MRERIRIERIVLVPSSKYLANSCMALARSCATVCHSRHWEIKLAE